MNQKPPRLPLGDSLSRRMPSVIGKRVCSPSDFKRLPSLLCFMNKYFKLSLFAPFLFAAQLAFAQLQDFNFQLRSTMEFPGQTLANVCGYWQNGKEYALLGGSKGMIIVDITNPDVPQQIVQIPAPEGPSNDGSLWKEIKVYKQYAYLVTEAGGGLQIIDLSALPSAILTNHLYTGDGAIAEQLDKSHALHIDVKKGFLYIFGGPLFSGGAKIFDLNQDPYNPRYVGKFDQLGYIHDGYVDNDTLYAGHINAGIMSIVDMADKANPTLLGTVETPGKFTHNTWITDDRKHVLTTDETTPSFLASYDVSDPTDIQELDRVSPNDGYGSYVHNTHILNDYAVTSWYTDGVMIVDAHRPQNLVIVGSYDTYAASNLDFEGCWGAFPFFPSGIVITTNITPGKLTVLTPSYKRACYLEGKITKACDGNPLVNAKIVINGGTDPKKPVTTRANGLYRTGQFTPGNFTATIIAPGYISQTININLATAQITTLNVVMAAAATFNASGLVLEAGTNAPIGNAKIALRNVATGAATATTTAANGQFITECIPSGTYLVTAGKWGYYENFGSVAPTVIPTIKLSKGYYDDFASDLDWTTSSTASSGDWVREEPDGTSNQITLVNPEVDASMDNNDLCYITGNGGGGQGTDDVDNGTVTLTCPVMDFAGYQDAVLTFYYWFYNGGGSGAPNDKMEVNVLNGAQKVNLLNISNSESAWKFSGEIHLKDFTTMTDNLRIEFVAHDDAPGHVVEAGVDIFKVSPGLLGVNANIDASATMIVSPNPSISNFSIQYSWENADEIPTLEVSNLLGQVVFTETLSTKTGFTSFGNNWNPGIYLASLRSAGHSSAAVKLVKQ